MTTCPSCATENPNGFNFCGNCGSSLSGPPSIAEERKVVTTLFCDLVGYTAHSEAGDPELIDTLLQRYNTLAKSLVRAHGGAVEKFIGDAVLAVFGFPKAHDDDAQRAVRCGLRLTEVAGELRWPDGDQVRVRVGVNTGEAYVHTDVDPASGETFLIGDAVNTAARLETVAPPGGVVVGEVTYGLTSQVIVYQELAPLVLKGKKQPVEAWLARGTKARTGLRTSGETSTPFLGRATELTALQQSFESAASSRKAEFVLLSGEPGIGKSRLVLEFQRSSQSLCKSVTWRQGRCRPFGEGVDFRALSDILEAHAGVLDSDDASIVEAKLKEVLPESEDRAWLLQRLRPLLGLNGSAASRGENFVAWERMMEVIAAEGPAVIVIEDLHWAGEAMLGFVEHLLAGDHMVPLLIVATTRPELLEKHVGLLTAKDGGRSPRPITLSALSQRDSAALVAELLGAEPTAEEGARIATRIGGNPLYAEQYVRLLLDRGLIEHTPDGVHLRADRDLPVPASVQATLAARMDTLPSEQKQLLCDAAVIGETFWCGSVAALSGCDSRLVGRVMAALAERDFVRPVVAPAMEGEVEYLFWHALVRDVAYGQLPLKVRARKHEAAALWIERRADDAREEFADTVAHHYSSALDLARASREETFAVALTGPAVKSLARAGHRSLSLDVEAAERLFARGLEIAGQDANLRLELLPGWAEALLLRSRFRESADTCQEAISGYEACADMRAAAVAMCKLAIALSSLGEPVGHLTRNAVELLADEDPSPEQAEVLGHYALSLLLLNDDPSSVIESATRAIGICRHLGLPEPAVARHCQGIARLNLGDILGTEDVEAALVAAREQGLGIERTTIEFNSVAPAFVTKGALAAYEVTREGLDFALRHGLEAVRPLVPRKPGGEPRAARRVGPGVGGGV